MIFNMEKEIIFGIIAGAVGYFLFKYYLAKKYKAKTNNYSDVLQSKEYKVKGQWDK